MYAPGFDLWLVNFILMIIMIIYAASGILSIVLYCRTPDRRWRRMKFWYAFASFVNVLFLTFYFAGYNDLAPWRPIGALVAAATILGSLITSYTRLVVDKAEVGFQKTREEIFVDDMANGRKPHFELHLVDPNMIFKKGKT